MSNNRDLTTYKGVTIPSALDANSGNSQVDWLIKLNDPTLKSIIDEYQDGALKIGNVVEDGTIGSVLFIGADTKLAEDSNLFWDNSTKRLGIGTNVPDAGFHLKKNSAEISIFQGANTAGYTTYKKNDDSTVGYIGFTSTGIVFADAINGAMIMRGDNGIQLGAGSSSDFTLLSNGSVGIGTITPTSTLSINGSFTTGSATDGMRIVSGASYTEIIGIDISQSGYNQVRIRAAAGNAALTIDDSRIGIGTNSPTEIVSINGQYPATLWMERNTTANTAGNLFTIQAGGATSSATDKNGGSLLLRSGISTGSGESRVTIQSYHAGSSGTSDNSGVSMIDILGNKMGVFNTTPVVQQNHIIDADGTLADITTKFNTLLSYLELYGWLKNA